MKLEPVIRVFFKKFCKSHDLEDMQDGCAFERFVNKMVLCQHQPNAFDVENGLLEAVSVGDSCDMGIDGLCIKLNGRLVVSIENAKDNILQCKNEIHELEFIFIQSKFFYDSELPKFDRFVNGVGDFLDEEFQPGSDKNKEDVNEKIKALLEIKNYLLGDEVQLLNTPAVSLYYVARGQFDVSAHMETSANRLKNRICKFDVYAEPNIYYVDNAGLLRICRENENRFTVTMKAEKCHFLYGVSDVSSAVVVTVKADELVHNMLKTKEGLRRRSLFEDNVRDYQGDTTINKEILETIENAPDVFGLLNNGITIVSKKAEIDHNGIKIENPQVVNGCQTCSVIFTAFEKGLDLSKVFVTTKVIATENDDLTSKIIKGTNRQNLVYDEAFEITRPFYKEMEQFFSSMTQSKNETPLYFERRRMQFADNTDIKVFQRVNFQILIQSFVSVFLNLPHEGHLYSSTLLPKYRDRIFIDTQSYHPYYAACKIHQKFEFFVARGAISPDLRKFKMQILWLMKYIVAGMSPDINNEEDIIQYCEYLFRELNDNTKASIIVENAINTFREIKLAWIKDKGESFRSAIKDSADFTNFMIERAKKKKGAESKSKTEVELQHYGEVKLCKLDRNSKFYGFIEATPVNIFFHETLNTQLSDEDYRDLKGKNVFYTPTINPKKSDGSKTAVDIRISMTRVKTN